MPRTTELLAPELAQLWRRALERPRLAARALRGRGLLRRLQVDSMQLLELIALIEERFDISLVDDELRRSDFDSLAALGRAVARRLGPAGR
ncbi:MAG TPA: acyl carrier protein [Acidobacteriota bacterium]